VDQDEVLAEERMDTDGLMVFSLASLLLCMAPGPDTAYILGRSTLQGRQAGVVAALGISAGILVHVTGAALGISALIAGSANAFLALKLVGAAYLVYLGVTTIAGSLRSVSVESATVVRRAEALGRIAWQGFLTDVLNPKVAIFFLAFLPQFVPPDRAGETWPLIVLGGLFVVIATLWNLLVAGVAAGIGDRVRGSRGIRRWLDCCLGSVFVYLGARLAFERAP
jgi:threonine/homoserine/homoserine lactone efflux protein